jgi:hypothetical protein
MQTVPFTPDPAQVFSCQIGEDAYQFEARYNERFEGWTFDLVRLADQVTLLAGAPLLLGQDLLGPYGLGIGVLTLTDLSNAETDAGPEDLGERVVATWLSPGEMELLRASLTAAKVPDAIAPGGAPGLGGPVGPGAGTVGTGGAGAGTGGTTTAVGEPVSFGSTSRDGDDSGAEVLIPMKEFPVDLSGLPSTFRFRATFECGSEAGTATIRAYIGGTPGVIDGTLVGFATVDVPGPTYKRIARTMVNPGGMVPVKFTIQSSGAGLDAAINAMTGSLL